MNKLQKYLHEYINDPLDFEVNAKLGEEYEKQGQGAAALFGEQNEVVEKTLLKVQATMAILNGLQELNTLITEKNVVIQRILNVVMKANPIFIILGVITAVTAAYAILTRKTEDNINNAILSLGVQGNLSLIHI